MGKSQQKSVLVIDDNKTFVMYAGLLLKRMGFEVISSNSALEALKLLKVITPDLVLLDIHMPEMDGFELLSHIRADPDLWELPVVMVTIDANPDTMIKGRALGCSDFLQKPIDLQQLHETLQTHVRYPGNRRRRFLRVAFASRVQVVIGEAVSEYQSVSLSEGGIYVRAKDPLAVGTKVGITLPVGHGKEIALSGTVIYRKEVFEGAIRIEPGMAIQFEPMKRRESFVLRRFIGNMLAGDLIAEQDEPVLIIPAQED